MLQPTGAAPSANDHPEKVQGTMTAEALSEIVLYTDGACAGNPGPGGWGAILVCREPAAEKELSGAEAHTTNNRMELTAVIEGLRLLQRRCRVKVVTDSQYVCDAFRRGWAERWQKNGWKTAEKKAVKNDDLWRELIALINAHEVEWQWIRGHIGHPYNERADRLAVAARKAVARKGSSNF